LVRYLKTAAALADTSARDREVRETVTALIEDVAKRGDVAVHELSRRFDNFDREDFRLTEAEIEASLAAVGEDALDDIRFAQAQVRHFAEVQRAALTDVEVETLPGVVLGHKNVPVDAVGCYVPGGKYPLLASAHMSVVTARVAGVKRIATVAPPFQGKPAPAIVAAQHPARPVFHTVTRGIALRRFVDLGATIVPFNQPESHPFDSLPPVTE